MHPPLLFCISSRTRCFELRDFNRYFPHEFWVIHADYFAFFRSNRHVYPMSHRKWLKRFTRDLARICMKDQKLSPFEDLFFNQQFDWIIRYEYSWERRFAGEVSQGWWIKFYVMYRTWVTEDGRKQASVNYSLLNV